ncbi:MAG TPA: Ig-like domain-containing protein [Anaerolineales bacterium]|nr:Ig-like domain-containing protein [Anaerolineales bacterium]
MSRMRWGLVLLVISLLLPLDGQPTHAQSERALYFPETGHWVSGEFLSAYESLDEPSLILGSPITDDFPDPVTGQRRQYFQKALLVLDSDGRGEPRVQQVLLGQLLYKPGLAPASSPNVSACRDFPDTGYRYRVCYAFLDFFESHGGLAQFGYPISNFEIHSGRLVQYFQKARFEWHPELRADQHILLGDLGIEYFRKAGEDPIRLSPNVDNNLPRSILSLDVRTFVEQAVTPFRGEQTLYVIVQDQTLQPIANAEVSYSVVLPSGESLQDPMPPTDENGVSSIKFVVDAHSIGVAEITILVNYSDLQRKGQTSFRIWW